MTTTTSALLFPLVFLAGVAGAAQASANAALAGRAGLGPAVLVNALVVLVGTLALNLASGSFRALPSVAGAPWYDYLGGVCGFAIIASMAYAFPRMGAALALAVMVLGQSTMALAIDHFGLWGIRAVPVTPIRLVGGALVVAGVALLRR
jgi:bacterial/archaeal transporter family-2 protein